MHSLEHAAPAPSSFFFGLVVCKAKETSGVMVKLSPAYPSSATLHIPKSPFTDETHPFFIHFPQSYVCSCGSSRASHRAPDFEALRRKLD